MFFKGEFQEDKCLNTTMLKIKRHPFNARIAALAALATIAATSVQAGIFSGSEEKTEIRKYDFAYSMQGEHKALPGQVFDDGQSTYFQFTRDDVPAIFTDDGNGASVAPVRKQGVYLVVAGVHSRYLLQLGSTNAAVTYVGARSIRQPETMPSKTMPASEAPGLTTPFSNGVRTEMDVLDQAKTARSYPNRIEYASKEDWDPVLPKNNSHAKLAQHHESKARFDVPFQVGKDVLGPKGKSVMLKLLDLARSSKKIIIEGGTDGHMGKSSLGLQRGIAMSDWLVKNGVDKGAIYVGEIDGAPSNHKGGINFSNIIIAERVASIAAVPTEEPKPYLAGNQISTTDKPSARKRMAVEGDFSVVRNEKSSKEGEKAHNPMYEFPIGASLNSEARTVISKYVAASGASIVMTDGSKAGYLKAKEIAEFIDFVSGFHPEIKTSGAPKGLILVKG